MWCGGYVRDCVQMVHVAMVRSVTCVRGWSVETIDLILKHPIVRRQTVASERKIGSTEMN